MAIVWGCTISWSYSLFVCLFFTVSFSISTTVRKPKELLSNATAASDMGLDFKVIWVDQVSKTVVSYFQLIVHNLFETF